MAVHVGTLYVHTMTSMLYPVYYLPVTPMYKCYIIYLCIKHLPLTSTLLIHRTIKRSQGCPLMVAAVKIAVALVTNKVFN
jgi:hypothetical protein